MEAEARQLVELPRRRSLPAAVSAALRPRQWSKNLLVFAGLVFAAKLGDAGRWGGTIAVRCASPELIRLLRITLLDRLIDVVPTREAAAAVRRAA